MQRLHVNPSQGYPHAGKPHINCQTVLRMATVAGAAAAGLGNKVGMLKVGMEADVILLQARAINTHPMNNAPGTVVTLMDTSNVDTVIIGGKVKKRAGKLVGVDLERLFKKIEMSQEQVLRRIHTVPIPVDGLHSAPGYTPSLVRSCCLAEEPYPERELTRLRHVPQGMPLIRTGIPSVSTTTIATVAARSIPELGRNTAACDGRKLYYPGPQN